MNSAKTQHSWEAFLKFYSNENKGRKTRLGAFERDGDVVNDYWIEDGLVLAGIDLDPNRELPTVEILLEGYSHSIADVRSLAVHYSQAAEGDGLDITDVNGKTTIFRFE
ncbi:MAG: hypothetical protein ABIR33_06515 [Pyrinomonadaceae bacterium]